jgi:mRNA interferase MazF
MRRGEIWMVELDLNQGDETTQRRPAVIVSNDRANAAATRLGSGVVAVVPISSHVDSVYPFQVFLAGGATGLPIDAKAQAEEVRSISIGRLAVRVGELQPAQLSRLDAALRLHLQL